MLKKLLLVVALIGIGAGSYGLARAYFTSQTTGPQAAATFTAGTISIDLTKNDANSSASIELNNWMPGNESWVAYDVKNTSTVPVTLTGHIDGTWSGNDSSGVPLGDQMVHVVAAEYWDGSSWVSMAAPNGTFSYAGPVPANGGVVTMRMKARFETGAGNDFQGKTYTASIFVTAEQVH